MSWLRRIKKLLLAWIGIVSANQPLKTIGLLAINEESAPYTPEVLSTSWMDLRRGYGIYLAGLPGIVYDGGRALVRGPGVIELCKKLDILFTWHWPHPDFVAELEAAGTKVYLSCAYEAVAAQPYGRSAPMWELSMQHLVVGTDGQPVNLNGPDTPIWAVDIARPELAALWVARLVETARAAGYVRPRFFYDSVIDRPNYGRAPNQPPTTPESILEYRRGWDQLLYGHIAIFGPDVWGNCTIDTPLYPELKQRWDEHFFRNPNTLEAYTLEEMKGRINNMRALKGAMGLMLGRQSVNRWADGPAEWLGLKEHIDRTKRDLYVMTVRDGLDAPIHHPGFIVARTGGKP